MSSVIGNHAPVRRALLVAIDQYDNFNSLPNCVDDAHAFRAMLVERFGFPAADIVMLTDAAATLATVRLCLYALFDRVGADDRIVFYFSGHGTTATREGLLRECLVLQDDLMFDDELAFLSSRIPPGVFSAVIDSCYSGGMDKKILTTVVKNAEVVARPRVKAYTRPDALLLQQHVEQQELSRNCQRFGERSVRRTNRLTSAGALMADNKNIIPMPGAGAERDYRLNGLLMSACLENEVASAGTAQSDGLSAFTFALISTVERLGPDASIQAILDQVNLTLRQAGFRQTSLVKEPPQPPQIRSKSLILFLPAGGDMPAMDNAGEGANAMSSELRAFAEALAELLRVAGALGVRSDSG